MTSSASLSPDKILKTPGPLERLFPGSSSACILDFMMLVAQKDHYFSESEIARYSGVSLKNAKAMISNLQGMGLVQAEMAVIAGKKKRNKVYAFSDADYSSSLSKALANLVLELTSREVTKTSKHTVKSADAHRVGDTVDELIDTGIIRLPGGKMDG